MALVAVLAARIEVAPGPIEDRFEQASLVCRGLVTAGTPCNWPEVNGKLGPADCSVSITVEAVYKGRASGPGMTLVFPHLDPMMGVPVGANREYLFFLRRSPSGEYFLPIETSGAQILVDRMSFPSGSRDGMRALESDVLDSASDAHHVRPALDLLSQFAHPSSAAIQRLQAIPTSTLDLSVLKLALLARSDPGQYLPALVTTLEAWSAANRLPDPAYPTIVPPGLAVISATLEGLTSARDMASLQRLAGSDQPGIRLSAMWGIRRLKDRATVPFLIAQLDSADNWVRYIAVASLAEITGKSGDFGPGKGPFDRDERKYIALWKAWWSEGDGQRK